MPDFYNITSWNEKPWFQTGGTRSKVVVENPETSDHYYFKSSLKKGEIDYKYEFWSEIAASEVGTILGFDMLRYDIAYNRGEIGCLSKSMNIEGKNKLTEGMSYLTGFDTTYNPEDKQSKKLYTFHFIRDTLNYFQLGHYIGNIIEIIVLDSIIGNGDRHQENWGIITDYNEVIQTLEDIAKKEKKGIFEKTLFALLAVTSKAKREDAEKLVKEFNLKMPGKFSQIYDSGSCLGREVDDDKVKQMLTDNAMIKSYIHKGVSEIHWEGEKLNHIVLIEKLQLTYPDIVQGIIARVKKNYTHEKIKKCILSIDEKLPLEFAQFKLPLDRKEFMVKLISLRVQNLLDIKQ
jgi:hypothetical protein